MTEKNNTYLHKVMEETNQVYDTVMIDMVNKGMREMAVHRAKEVGDIKLAEKLSNTEDGMVAYAVASVIHGEKETSENEYRGWH